jgi:1-acyl-sn-glycerol-3-phosphate acyltransferase
VNGYAFLHRIGLRTFLRTLYRIDVTGGEHIPAEGGVILASNHESLVDPFILGVATTRPIRYMAKTELWSNRLVGALMDWLGTFPIDRGGGDTLAMGRGAQLLRAGEVLGIFPQGTSKPWRRRPFHRGAARLALATGAPVVPVCMIGTERVLRPNKVRIGLPRVRILVGAPIAVEPARPTLVAAKAITDRIERTIGELRAPYGPPAHVWLD